VKVSDLIAEFLSKNVKHVFTVSGGADLHLIHSIWEREDIEIICPQNEQSASFAADAYARLNGLGCALATSGPGASNLITGIATSYYDSIPVLYLTGNQTVDRMQTFGTRQYGFQSTPIVEMVKHVTKLAVTVTNPRQVMYLLEEAVKVAKKGRPGPVLIDLPDDVQRVVL
jgi:acetolactate synthase-1/2/3 large subunit